MKATRSFFSGCLLWLLSVAAAAQGALSAGEFALDIKQQSLPAALKAFRKQTGLHLISYSRIPRRAKVGPLLGHYTAEAALSQLLANSGVTCERVNERAFALKKAADTSNGKPLSKTQLELRPEPASPAGAIGRPVERIVVSGVRMALDQRFTSPRTVIAREAIDKQGVSSVGELVKNLSQHPYSRAGGAQYPELRGLGPGTTVVLINGRRVAPSAADAADSFDLSALPIAAVDRVEIILEPTSVATPSAVGGMVNVVLVDDVPYPIVELQYGTADGGASERRFSAIAATANEHLSSTLVLEYLQRDFLLGAQRELWRNQDYSRFGGRDYRTTASSPGNIRSLSGFNLPGLSSSRAAVPANGDLTTLTAGDFQSTAGLANLESLSRYYSVLPAVKRGSVVGLAELQLPAMTAFGELLYTSREIIQQRNPPILLDALVPAGNPFNPFGVPVVADVLLVELPAQQTHTDSELFRSVIGLRGARRAWDWELSLVNTFEDLVSTSFTGIPADRVSAALAQSDPARSLNVFKPGGSGSVALLEWLTANRTSVRGSSTTALLTATLTGEFPSPLGGDISALFGSEQERTRASFTEAAHQSLQRDASAAFAQFRVPLAHPSLHLIAGARLERVSGVGDMLSPLYALQWQPLNSLSLHASYGESSRAPSLLELMLPRLHTHTTIVDTRRRSEVRHVDVVVGGNPDLNPVTAEIRSLGFEWTPPSTASLKLSATWWDISLRDQIIVPPLPLLLDHEVSFAERVVRDAPTPEDLAAGRPGPLRLLDFSRMNSGRLDTRGIDFEISQQTRGSLGNFSSTLAVTLIDRFTTANLPDIPGTNRAGIASPYGTIPKWRATASFEWNRDRASLGTRVRYVPAYADAVFQPTGRTIPAQTIVDLEASWCFDQPTGRTTLRDVTLSLGVQNIFDEAPPFAEVGGAAGFDLSQGDLRQRFAYVKVTSRFE